LRAQATTRKRVEFYLAKTRFYDQLRDQMSARPEKSHRDSVEGRHRRLQGRHERREVYRHHGCLTSNRDKRLQGMEQGFASRGMAPEQATSAALAALDRMVTGQAAAISFNLAFLSLALLFVVAVPCLLAVKAGLTLLGRRRRDKTAEA
jgi:hypothetical protein